MITAPETAVVGVSSLKQELSRLAKGEQVIWRNMATEPVPGQMITDLTSFCNDLEVKLEKL